MTLTLGPAMLLGDRYRLLERIAAGGQGEVWRAEDTGLGRPVALKVLRGEYAGNAEFRDRFRREARHAAGLSHPGVAQVFDYDEGQGATPPYLVMEYVEGESLSATITRDAPLGPDRVLEIIAAAAAALAVAHAAGLVHRDVKPGNVLVGRDGSIKITDFGIARAVDAVPLTRTGVLMGTPLYLAPEQAAGRPATAACDLYALGVIAYELLTGAPPYEGPAPAVLLAHRDTPLPALPPQVPAGLRDLVVELTAKDPAMRPAGAALVAARAARLRADPAVTVTDGMTQVLAMPFAEQPFAEQPFAEQPFAGEARRRNRALALVVGGLAIALLAGIVGWAVRPSAAGQPATVRPPAATPSDTQAAHPSPRATAHRPPPVRHPPIPKGHQPKPRNHGHGHHHH